MTNPSISRQYATYLNPNPNPSLDSYLNASTNQSTKRHMNYKRNANNINKKKPIIMAKINMNPIRD